MSSIQCQRNLCRHFLECACSHHFGFLWFVALGLSLSIYISLSLFLSLFHLSLIMYGWCGHTKGGLQKKDRESKCWRVSEREIDNNRFSFYEPSSHVLIRICHRFGKRQICGKLPPPWCGGKFESHDLCLQPDWHAVARVPGLALPFSTLTVLDAVIIPHTHTLDTYKNTTIHTRKHKIHNTTYS